MLAGDEQPFSEQEFSLLNAEHKLWHKGKLKFARLGWRWGAHCLLRAVVSGVCVLQRHLHSTAPPSTALHSAAHVLQPFIALSGPLEVKIFQTKLKEKTAKFAEPHWRHSTEQFYLD